MYFVFRNSSPGQSIKNLLTRTLTAKALVLP
jgi:hypothetical protein